MERLCPVCNGLAESHPPCPVCHSPLRDLGPAQDAIHACSPYREKGAILPGDGQESCSHLFACPTCCQVIQQGIPLIIR